MTSSNYSNPTRKVNLNLSKINKSKIKGGVRYDVRKTTDAGSLVPRSDKNKQMIDEVYKPRYKSDQTSKILSGNISFPLGPLQGTMYGSKTRNKGKYTESDVFGSYESTWKNVENQLGAELGYEINEKNRVGIDVNKNFFKGQKGSRSNVGLNWNAQVGDGFLNVTLSGSDRNKQGKALQLRYNIPTSKLMRFFK
tara:strand:+ start:55 stop:639 length:585 start_codon:yes stop_codon:yes gene_type:complete